MTIPKPGPAPQVDPDKLRDAVADILSQPAPTSLDRVEQFEAAHELLHDALGSNSSHNGNSSQGNSAFGNNSHNNSERR